MDKIQKAQIFSGSSDSDNPLSDFKKILEINPHHKVNQIILERIQVILFSFRVTQLTWKWKNSSNFFIKQLLSTQDFLQEIPISL